MNRQASKVQKRLSKSEKRGVHVDIYYSNQKNKKKEKDGDSMQL
jgi:hypothetical protein